MPKQEEAGKQCPHIFPLPDVPLLLEPTINHTTEANRQRKLGGRVGRVSLLGHTGEQMRAQGEDKQRTTRHLPLQHEAIRVRPSSLQTQMPCWRGPSAGSEILNIYLKRLGHLKEVFKLLKYSEVCQNTASFSLSCIRSL